MRTINKPAHIFRSRIEPNIYKRILINYVDGKIEAAASSTTPHRTNQTNASIIMYDDDNDTHRTISEIRASVRVPGGWRWRTQSIMENQKHKKKSVFILRLTCGRTEYWHLACRAILYRCHIYIDYTRIDYFALNALSLSLFYISPTSHV